MSFFDTFSEMLVILFAMAMGFLAHRLGFLNGETDRRLTKLLLNITMPAMIVAAVVNGENMPGVQTILSVLGVSAVFYLFEFAFVLAAPRFLGGTAAQRGVWRYALAFPNVAFIGYPVAVALFGPEALFYAVILVMPFNLLSYTLGPLMLAGAARFQWKQLLSPCVVAAVIALILALAGLRPPALVGEMLGFVGDITVPLSLVMIGSLLSDLPARQVFASPRIWALAALRLLVMPAALLVLLRALNVETMVLGIAVTQMAMPVAVNGTMLSMEYGGDTDAMAQATFLTTLGSIVTIPAVAALLL